MKAVSHVGKQWGREAAATPERMKVQRDEAGRDVQTFVENDKADCHASSS